MIGNLKNKILSGENNRAFLIISIVVVLTNCIPFVLGRNQDPTLQRSGLATSVGPGLIGGQSTIDPNDGFTSQTLGKRAADSWLHGDVPYWNRYEGIGTPLAGGMQSAAFFPLVLLLHFEVGFLLMHILLQIIAGVFTYLFLKRFKLGFMLAVLGGLLFSFNGTFAWLTNAAFNPVAFLPMLLLGIEYAFERAKSKKQGGWVLIAIALSLSIYSGFPETAFISALFAYGWAAIRLFQLDAKLRRSYITKMFLGSLSGLLLAAPIIIPFLGYLPEAMTGGHDSNAYANFALPIKTLPDLVMPYLYGPIFALSDTTNAMPITIFWSNVGGFITIPLLFAAIIGLFSKLAKPHKIYLAVAAILIVLKTYGFRPVVVLVNLIPGMKQVAFYRYSTPVLSMALIMLGMFGLQAIAKAQISKKRQLQVAAGLTVFVIILAQFSRSLLRKVLDHSSAHRWAILSVCWALASLGLIGLTIYRSKKYKHHIIGAILLVDAILMFSIPYLALPKIPSVDLGPVTFLQKNIGLDRFYTLHPIAPNYGSHYGIASININDLPIPKKWNDYIPEKLDKNTNPIIFTGFSRVDQAGPTALQEFNRNIQEYEKVSVKYLVTDKGQVTDELLKQMPIKRVYVDNTVEIFELLNVKPYYQTTSDCVLSSQSANTLQSDCHSPANLVRHELSMPGWSVKINGIKHATQTTDKVFQSITIPKGKANIKFSYSPPYIGVGYVLFAIGLAMVIGPSIYRLERLSRTNMLK